MIPQTTTIPRTAPLEAIMAVQKQKEGEAR
jgi:hypothetical protein